MSAFAVQPLRCRRKPDASQKARAADAPDCWLDRSGEAARHVLDFADAPVFKSRSNHCCFVNARSAVLPRELMRAHQQFPIEDMVEPFHGGSPRVTNKKFMP